MARQTLYNFGRANRSGTFTTPTFTIPATEGVLRGTLDVLPNHRADADRIVDFFFEVELTPGSGVFETISHGRWQGNPDTTTMPTEEFLSVAGGVDMRNCQARWRVVVTNSCNFGGTIEWLDYTEGGWRAQG